MWITVFTAALLTSVPATCTAAETEAGHGLLTEIQQLRAAAGNPPLALHNALCDAAVWRAGQVAGSGSPSGDMRSLRGSWRRLHTGGYFPHNWTESTLVAGREDGLLEQWRQVKPEWLDTLRGGDFEHIGLGLARFEGRPVVSLVLALPRSRAEWRQAAPLADLAASRRLALEAVNRAREEHQRRPLVSNPQLDAAAQAHAEDMLRRAYYDHRSPEGNTPLQRARAAGYRPQRVISENIAKGLFEPAEVVDRWLASSGHRRNILRSGTVETGFGVAFGNNKNGFEVIWVQLFAGR